MIEQIGYGILTGFSYSLLGWRKTVSKDKGSFDIEKILKTTLICGIVGGISAYLQTDFNILINGSIGIAVTNIFNIVYKITKNNFNKYVNNLT